MNKNEYKDVLYTLLIKVFEADRQHPQLQKNSPPQATGPLWCTVFPHGRYHTVCTEMGLGGDALGVRWLLGVVTEGWEEFQFSGSHL